MESLGYSGHWILLSLSLSLSLSLFSSLSISLSLQPSHGSNVTCHLLRRQANSLASCPRDFRLDSCKSRWTSITEYSRLTYFASFLVLAQWVNKDTETIWTVHLANLNWDVLFHESSHLTGLSFTRKVVTAIAKYDKEKNACPSRESSFCICKKCSILFQSTGAKRGRQVRGSLV